jgi:hypothetical protein
MKLVTQGETTLDSFISIKEIVNLLALPGRNEEGNSHIPVIHLPTFQRDLVWKSKQICELWDSLLRGIPLPSMIISKVGSSLGTTDAKEESELKAEDYWLLDGQQRATALQCGLGLNIQQKLWIDLAWNEQDEATHGRRFGLFLCSKARPWGDSLNLVNRPGSGDVRNARRFIHQQKPLDGIFDFEISLDRTWPVAAKSPVPFTPMVNLALQSSDPSQINEESIRKELNIWLARDVNALPENMLLIIDKKINGDLTYLVKGLKKLCFTKISLVEAELDDRDLLATFTRLNRNGSRVTDEELFYSGLKKTLRESQMLVSQIVRSTPIFGELDVLRAFTILASQQEKEIDNKRNPTNTLLTPDFLNSLIKSEVFNFTDRIKSYIANGSLVSAMVAQLRHNSDVPNDPGLPLVMLPRLKVRTWLPILRWLEKRNNKYEVTPDERISLIRFALTDHIFADWNKNPDVLLRDFIDMASQYAEQGKPLHLPSSEGWLKNIQILDAGGSGSERPHQLPLSPDDVKERFARHCERHHWAPDNDGHIWVSERWKDLLMWSQRRALDEWFGSLEKDLPTLGETGQPWDIDHIVPNDFFNYYGAKEEDAKQGLNNVVESMNEPGKKNDWDKIKSWRGRIGNYRLWPMGFNRKDGDLPAKIKLNPELPDDNDGHLVLVKWLLDKTKEQTDGLYPLMTASAIETSQRWLETPENKKCWSELEIEAFLQSVLDRENCIYANLWNFIKPSLPSDMQENRL